MATEAIKQDILGNTWLDKQVYDDAETIYYEKLAKEAGVTVPKQQSLANEVAKARQQIKSSLENVTQAVSCPKKSRNSDCDDVQKQFNAFQDQVNAVVKDIMSSISNLTARVEALEVTCATCTKPTLAICPQAPADYKPKKKEEDDDEDVDLFGSDSEGEDEAAQKIKEQRLAEYQSKKSKKPVLVAKSNIIFDVKPWDDETDMKLLENAVREIKMDGLIWGASKLVPLAYGIFKLQISSVVEDEKVSVDLLQETIESIEDYVQSADIAAFNKV